MTATGRPLLDVETFFADSEFAEPSISLDGNRIAYLAPPTAAATCGSGVSTRPTTTPSLSPTTPRRGITRYLWSDDPRWLLYPQDTDGDEDWHLHRVDLDTPGEPAVDLTPMAPRSRVFVTDPETT